MSLVFYLLKFRKFFRPKPKVVEHSEKFRTTKYPNTLTPQYLPYHLNILF